MAMGLAAAKLGVYGKPLIAFSRCLSECVAYLANSLMWYVLNCFCIVTIKTNTWWVNVQCFRLVPIAIVFILISDILNDSKGDITKIFLPYSPLIMCLTVGQVFWIAIIVILYKIFTKKSIRTLFYNLLPTLMVAFGTGLTYSQNHFNVQIRKNYKAVQSFYMPPSELTIPVTLTCLDINGVNPRVSRFLVPVGASICESFNCMMATVGAMFMLQYNDNFGITIPAWKYFLVR